jgi:hypothetical protein
VTADILCNTLGCPCEATAISVDPPAGRARIVAAYCDEHGGTERAQREVARDWALLAPPEVGGDAAVTAAGVLGLGSEHVYVVVREDRPAPQPSRWTTRIHPDSLARLRALRTDRRSLPGSTHTSLDSAQAAQHELLALGVEATVEEQPAVARAPDWLAQLGVGSHVLDVGRFDTEAAAEAAGRSAWREELARRVAEITAARGGTLSWGIPLDPPVAPIVLRPAIGQSAWDALTAARGGEP